MKNILLLLLLVVSKNVFGQDATKDETIAFLRKYIPPMCDFSQTIYGGGYAARYRVYWVQDLEINNCSMHYKSFAGESRNEEPNDSEEAKGSKMKYQINFGELPGDISVESNSTLEDLNNGTNYYFLKVAGLADYQTGLRGLRFKNYTDAKRVRNAIEHMVKLCGGKSEKF